MAVINSIDIMDALDEKITVDLLKAKKLKRYYSFCKNDKEKEEVLQFIEKAFEVISPFLNKISSQEYEALSEYGRKIGAISYEINDDLRKERRLSYRNEIIVKLLDSAINKFELKEDIVVYRALKLREPIEGNPEDIVGTKVIDKGYMSTSLIKELSYASFKEYNIVLEIKLPAGSKCVYLEWFKGANDEKELLIGRGTSLLINGIRRELINENEKIVYSCEVIERELQINEDNSGEER